MAAPGFQTDGPIAETPGTIFDYESSLGEASGAAFQRQTDTNPSAFINRGLHTFGEDWEARFGGPNAAGTDQLIDAKTARAEVAQSGLDIKIGDGGISRYELSTLKYLKQRELNQQTTMARRSGPITSLAELGAGLGGSFLDPINVASGFIPFVPEARYLKWLQEAGSFGERSAIRAGVGAIQGSAAMAAIEPINYFGAQSEQLDYGLQDSFMNVVFGGLMAGGLHVVGGAWHDWRGLPLSDAMTRQDAANAPDNVKLAAMHSAVQSLENGEPVHAQDVFEAYHGSPHVFDAFDNSKIGSGEGAQSYGHGLYFAEKESTARYYRDTLTAGGGSYKVDVVYKGQIVPDKAIWYTAQHLGVTPDRAADLQQIAMAGGLDEAIKDARKIGATERVKEFESMRGDIKTQARPTGALYQARIKGRPEEFIDFDKPLSEQSPQVRAALESIYPEGFLDRHQTVGQLLPTSAESAKDLRMAGIKGVQYLDGASRAAGEGTRNYVVFDHNDVEIAARNGEPIKPTAQPDRSDVQTSAQAAGAAKLAKGNDLETVAADHKFLDAQIDGLKKRDLWKPEDDAGIKAGDEQAQKLSLAAQIYRAAAVCMGE